MKILIAEDEPVSRRFLQALLVRWGYEVVSVTDGDAAWEQLTLPDAPRMALLDWMMPGQNGVDVCKKLRQMRPDPYTFLLLLTAKDATENIVEGLESGADDYLTKPFHPQELRARLRVGLRVLELEDNLVKAREGMRFKAMHDILTGVWNRGAILESLERELNRSFREGPALGLIMGDIDHFKSINDTYGHVIGDAVLREVTQRMQRTVRPYDSVGRYGGEEFLVLLPNCDTATTSDKAEQIRKAIVQVPIETTSGPIRVSMSFGGISTTDYRECSSTVLLQMADAALYRAKNTGRNRVVMGDADERMDANQLMTASISPTPEKK